MDYLKIVFAPGRWQVFRGIGTDGERLGQRGADGRTIEGFSAVREPGVWVYGRRQDAGGPFVATLRLPDLAAETREWTGGRIGALAAAPGGDRAVALALPDGIDDGLPVLHLWRNGAWSPVPTPDPPDISSGLAWISDRVIAYESSRRRLVVLDPATGEVERGPAGFQPTAATDAGAWYAIHGEKVVRFPAESPFAQSPDAERGFAFGELATIRVTRDGRVFTWTEPRLGHRSKGYVQERDQKRLRFRAIDDGAAIGAVIGPYARR